ncbi:MAG: sensor histidine kinase [Oceanospirillaceae bacterium]|nr:sensor histidine kinase [Oceanospirillaceae bacterium]
MAVSLAAVLLALFAAHRARDWTLQQLHRQGAETLLERVSEMRGWLDGYDYLPFLLTQNRDVRALLLYPNQEMGVRVSRYLEQTSLVAGSTALFILDVGGRAVAFSNWRDQQDFYLRSHARRNYFLDARKGEQGRRFALAGDTGSPAFYLSAPIYDARRFVGAAVVRLNLELLQRRLGNAGLPWLLSGPEGTLIAASEPTWVGRALASLSHSEQVQRLLNGTEIRRWPEVLEGRRLAQSVELDDLGWTLTVLQDSEPAERNSRTAGLFTLGGSIAFCLLLLYLRERRLKHRSQRETQLALRRSEQRQRDIIDTAQVGLITVDSAGRMLFLNGMALKQFGLSPKLALQQPLSRLFCMSQAAGPLEAALSRLGSSGFAPLTGQEAVGRRADGSEFPLMFSIREMPGNGQRRFLVTVIDISRRKRLEQALRDARDSLEDKVEARTRELHSMQQELIQAEKLAALGRMSSAVVHELNQPLTAMRTYVAICRQLNERPDLLAGNLEQIDALVDRMALITRQLKTFAYRKPERLEPVSLGDCIDRTLALFGTRFDETGVELSVERCSGEDRVAGDSARLEQVLINLIGNALDAMTDTQGTRRLALRLTSRGEQLQLEVCDSGGGIAEDVLDKLFDPFFTTKSIGSGLGLGLAIVRSILRDLGGDIDARNRAGGGACFRLWLPAWVEVTTTNDRET